MDIFKIFFYSISLKAEDNTEFSITFYDTENGIFIGEMPDWAVYFFSTLTIIGLILVAATAFSLIRG